MSSIFLLVNHEKSAKIPHTHFQYFFSLCGYFVFTLQSKKRLRWTSKLLFFPLNENFVQVPSGAINIKIYRTHTYIQDWFLSLNSFNKFPWATNAESWSWKRLVAGIHRKTRQWFKPFLRRSVI